MRSLLAVVAVASLSACGGNADFTGIYAGALTYAGTCSDGSSGSGPNQNTWNITDSGDVVNISTNGPCGLVLADAHGDSATMHVTQCATVVTSSQTTTGNIASGTVTLTGNSLQVHFVLKRGVSEFER